MKERRFAATDDPEFCKGGPIGIQVSSTLEHTKRWAPQ